MHRFIRLCGGLALLALFTAQSVFAARAEHWIKVQSPYFTIYSEGGEKETRDWAAKFEEFRLVLGDLLHVTPTRLPPVQVMIFRSDLALEPFKPVRRDRSMSLYSFTVNSPLLTGISLSFEGNDAMTAFGIFWGGTHWFLSGLEAPGPAWFRAGLAEVFITYETQGDEALIGANRKQHVDWIKGHGFAPLEQFFQTSVAGLAQDDARTKAYQAQAWALVHYLLLGRGPGSAEQLGNFLALSRATAPAAAFTQAFGVAPAQMDKELRDYFHNGHNHVKHIKYGAAEISKGFQFAEAPAVEIEAAKGYLLLLNDDRDAARGYFERARAAAPGHPKPLEGLGDLAFIAGDAEEAARHWEEAVQAGSKNFNVYFQLALTLMQLNPGFDGGRGNEVNPQLARKVANYLERAINLNPYYIRSFEYLPPLLGYYAEPTDEDARFLGLGLQLMPGNPLLEAGQAVVALKSGRTAEARERLEKLSASAQPLPAAAAALVKFCEARLKFGEDLSEVEALITAKKLDEAEAAITQLLRRGMPAEIRQKLNARRTYVSVLQVLQQVDEAIVAARWTDAEILVRPLAESADDPELQALAKARLEEIQRRRADKKT
jgi:tetratricopeptide (TPR) repeat protein